MQVEVTQLCIYPIKSCAGIPLQHSEIDHRGLKWDREWVIVDEQGQMLTQRTAPIMTLIQPTITEHSLLLQAPTMPELAVSLDLDESVAMRLRIWDDLTLGADQGEAAAAWLSQFLQQPCRLLRVHTKAQRGLSQTWVRKWLQADLAPAEAPDLAQTHFGFADGFPFLICNQASLDELNTLIVQQGADPIGMSRFRPNIVIQGLEAYEEDYVWSLVGEHLQFAKLKNCTRCPLPNVDPLTAEIGLQPALALRDSRRTLEGVTFGINVALFGVEPVATLAVGQCFTAEFNF